jgi:hypothetical protein
MRIFRDRVSSLASFWGAVFSNPTLDLFFGGFSVSAETVETAAEDMHDRQEIFGELLLGRGALVTENHELDALAFEDPADEFESEPAESVAMGNAHFL